jgi:hypothetical protein
MSRVKLPLLISILSPMPSGTLPRGRHSPKGADPQRAFRCSDDKWAAIVEASDLLDMSYPEFCRWVSYAAANEVLRIAREQRVAPTPVKIEVHKQPLPELPIRTVINPYRK